MAADRWVVVVVRRSFGYGGGRWCDNRDGVRLGMVLAMTAAPCYGVWGYALTKVLEEVVGKDSILVPLARVGAAWTTITVLVPSSFWLTAAYRPDALPDWMIQMLYDMAWLLIDLAYAVTSVQLFALGVGFLADRRAKPLVPKWLAWYGIWVGFMFIARIPAEHDVSVGDTVTPCCHIEDLIVLAK